MSDLYGYSADNFMGQLPAVLYDSRNTFALAEIIAKALESQIGKLPLAAIYSRIDELPEELLDILARDFRIDWYNYDYPVEAKRNLIKTNYYVHKHLGTRGAVKSAVVSVYPHSDVEEWFQYDGEPYHFRVVIELSRSIAPANATEIRDAIYKTKREAAHLEMIIFQWNVGITIRTSEKGYLYDAAMTGTYECGTRPWRSTDAVLSSDGLAVRTGTASFRHESTLTGTVPWRNKEGGMGHGEMEAGTAGTGTFYDVPLTGTLPFRNKESGMDSRDFQIETSGRGFSQFSAFTGQTETGTVPWRNQEGGFQESGLVAQATAESHVYASEFTGQYETGAVPFRNAEGGVTNRAASIRAGTEAFPYAATFTGQRNAGETPVRNAEGGEETGTFSAEADGEGFAYRARMCGETYCGQDFI